MVPDSVQKTIDKVRAKWDPQYDVVVNRFVPWAPLRKPLREARLALVKPPRAAWVRFPRGAVLGEPGNPEKHLAVLRHCLRLWTELTTPGELVELPYPWRR